MASDILHIKDSYYFRRSETTIWSASLREPRRRSLVASLGSFAWTLTLSRLGSGSLHPYTLAEITGEPTQPRERQVGLGREPKHTHANHGKPLDRYLNDGVATSLQATARTWASSALHPTLRDPVDAYLSQDILWTMSLLGWFLKMNRDPQMSEKLRQKASAADANAARSAAREPAPWIVP
jgi:hypothetical protein